MTRPNGWHSPDVLKPEDGQVVWAMNSAGAVAEMKYVGRGLWYLGPRFEMYAYYTPTFWQEKEES
jgi:hypothetical protein